MDDGNMILQAISLILQIFSLSIGLYYFFIGLAGFLPIKDKNKQTTNKNHRFALLVAAHNEEQVIANMVKSLKEMDYPEDCYDIFVIADNCTDATAVRARDAGAFVYERHDSSHRGKGYALEWMFNRLYELENQYDYVAIFDADNLVDPGFLKAMNKRANQGFKVIQGFLDSKNPYDSWITASYSYCFWSVNRIFQLSRYKLGMCCELSGTGFVLGLNILKKLGWGATCLTEDMEFTMKLALNGEKVAFAYDAKIYDEKPLTLAQSWKQRTRWMQGHWDVASRYFWKLIRKGIREKNWSCIDCATYLVQPIRIIAIAIITFFAYVETFGINVDFLQARDLAMQFVPGWIWQAIVVVQMIYTPFVVCYEQQEIRLNMLWYYIGYILYNFTWAPIAIMGGIKKNQTDWSHTQHTRTISLEELQVNRHQ